MNENLGLGCIGIFVLVFVLFIIFSFTGLHINTGSGSHVGYITSVERNGLIFKTGRAYVKTDTQSSQEDQYCVMDEVVEAELKALAEKKAHVEVHYFSWIFAGISNCGGEGAIIDSVKEL